MIKRLVLFLLYSFWAAAFKFAPQNSRFDGRSLSALKGASTGALNDASNDASNVVRGYVTAGSPGENVWEIKKEPGDFVVIEDRALYALGKGGNSVEELMQVSAGFALSSIYPILSTKPYSTIYILTKPAILFL